MKMSISPSFIATALTSLALFSTNAQAQERTWTSTGGQTMKGEIVGVKDGKVLIRPVVKPKSVPITSLSKKDQEFIAKWEKEEVARVAAAKAMELERHMNTPLLKALKGNLQKLDDDGKKLIEYEIPTPGKLELIAVYYTAVTWPREDGEDQVIDNSALREMSKMYSRLQRRYPHFELVLYPLDPKESTVIEFMDDERIKFPTLKHSEVNTANGMAVRATFPGRIPSLLLMDREGKVLVNSLKDNKTQPWNTVLDEIQDIVKDRAPEEEE